MKIYLSLFLLLALHLLILNQLQFTAWPEMLSYPFFLNNGFKLYQDMAFPYQPLLVFILSAVYKVFGYSVINLQIFTWSIILLNDLLIFLIIKKILNTKLSLVTVLFYILFQSFTDGNMLWFDLATVPFILGGLITYLYLNNLKKYLWFGFFLSLAALTKQQVALAGILVLLFLVFSTKSFKIVLCYVLGAIIPALGVLVYVLANGILSDYIFWTFQVPIVWYPKFPGYAHLPSSREWLRVVLIFSPIIVALVNYKKWYQINLLLFLIFIATFLTSFPRFEYFRLQPTIAILIIITAIFISWSKRNIALFAIIALLFAVISIPKHFQQTNDKVRFYSAEDISEFQLISSKTSQQDKIYLLGLSSMDYVFSAKLTSKPWVDNYIWYMEIPGIQQKVIDGFKQEGVKYIFWKNPQPDQWFELGSYQPKQIVDYIRNDYTYLESFNNIQLWVKKD